MNVFASVAYICWQIKKQSLSDGRMDRRTEGRTDARMDGWTGRQWNVRILKKNLGEMLSNTFFTTIYKTKDLSNQV